MAALADNLRLLFTIQADGSQASKEFKKVASDGKNAGKEIGDSGEDVSRLTQAIGSIPAVASGALTAIAAIGAVAVATGAAIFKLTQNFAEYGNEISKAQRFTGLSAETLSALRLAAQDTDVDFDSLNDKVRQFSRNLGLAAQGGDEAIAKMKRLGVDVKATTASSEGFELALRQLFTRLNELPEGFARTNAAQDAFGEEGTKLLPIIARFNGDIDKMIDHAKRLGVVLSEEDVRASREFNQAFKEVQAIIQGVGFTLGREFLPTIRFVFNDFSSILQNNQKEVAAWAQRAGDIISGFYTGVKNLFKLIQENATAIRVVLAIGTFGASEGVINYFNTVISALEAAGAKQREIVGDAVSQGQSNAFFDFGATDEAEKRQKEREAIAKRDAAAQIQILQNQFDQIESEFEQRISSLRDKFKESGDVEGFAQAANEVMNRIAAEGSQVLALLFEAQTKALQLQKGTAKEAEALQSEQAAKAKQAQDNLAKSAQDTQKIINEGKKKAEEESAKTSQEGIQAATARLEADAQVTLARLKANLAEKLISEEAYAIAVQTVNENLLQAQLDQLNLELKATTENKEEQAKITEAIVLKEFELEAEKENRRAENAERAKEAALALKAIKEDQIATERELADVQADSARKALEIALSKSFGQARLQALTALRDFEIAEAERQRQAALTALELEKNNAIERIKGKQDEEAQKAAIIELYQQKALISEAEFQAQLKAIREEFNKPIQIEGENFFDRLNRSLTELLQRMPEIQNLGATMQGFASLTIDAFQGMANAVGSAIEGWAIYGESISVALRKALAAELAHIAGVAAINAIYATALGFLRLAQWDFAAAGNAFISAGIWASIAGVAAIAAKGVAGNTFQNQTTAQGAFNQQTSSGGGSSQSGGSFSGQADGTIEVGRNSPFNSRPIQNTVIIKDKSQMFEKLFEVEFVNQVNNNTRVRSTIKKLSNG